MKIGALEIYWHPGKSTVRDMTIWHLRTDPEVRKILATLGRSEIKNYLAQISELAELPYFGPVEFLHFIKQGVSENADNPTPDT